jgi:hypothetical protein
VINSAVNSERISRTHACDQPRQRPIDGIDIFKVHMPHDIARIVEQIGHGPPISVVYRG